MVGVPLPLFLQLFITMRDFKFLQGEPEQSRAREAYNRVLQRRNEQPQEDWWNEPDVVQSMESNDTSSENRIEVLQQRIRMLQNVIDNYQIELTILTE